MRAAWLDGDQVRESDVAAEARAAYEGGAVVWLDFWGPSTPDGERLLSETFKLHPLVIEDFWGERALPKIEDFEDYLFILVHGVHRGNDLEVSTEEIDLVLGHRFVITHHPEKCAAVDAVRTEILRSPKFLRKGPAWIVHGVLDHLVDHYLPILDEFDAEIERLEDEVLAKAGTHEGTAVMTKLLGFKRTLQSLRRLSIYQRELLLRLSRGEFDEIPKEAMPFFRDVFDHFARVTDLADGYRELVSSALEAYLSVQSNRMNEVMKTLTLMSTVMLPLTFIAGLYGMNFKYMPELDWRYGYPAALGLMVTVAVSILLWFRHKRWV